jgi:thiol-disulfide isomerase/thioredoxin
MKPLAILSLLLLSLPASSMIREETLGLGSKAPRLSLEEWIQGDAVTSFQPGRVYVVEFWATWCPPCRTSIPHLNELSKKYADQVTVIGVAASEKGVNEDLAKARTVLADFVKSKADTMTYRVGFDPDRSMSTEWMKPAGQGGIPTAFIVDRTGTIAWIGHPMEMEKPLESIVAGKWDVAAEAKKAAEAKALQEKAEKLYEVLGEAMQAQDYAKMLAACNAAFAEEPKLEGILGTIKFEALLRSGDNAGASAYGTKLVQGTFKDEAGSLNRIAWLIADPDDTSLASRDYKLAIAAATRANEVTEGKDPSILDTLAVALFGSGDAAKAIEIETKAVELAKGSDQEADFTKRLEEFKKARK